MSSTMPEVYRKQFNEIMNDTKGRKQTLLLANLMTQMESYYGIPFFKERFECETDPAVKELYLAVSNSRKL